MAEELLQLGRRGGQVDLVAGLQFKVAGGDDGLPLAGHGADQHPHPQVPVEVGKAHAVQLAALPDTILHQLHAALGEGLQLDGVGEAQHTGDLAGGGLLRIDDHGKAQILPHEAQLLFILRVADTGDGMAHAQLLGHQARHNVDLIAGGGGDQQVGLVRLRLLLHLIDGAVAADAHHIMDIDDVVNKVIVMVDDRYLVFLGQLLRQRQAYFARAHDNDSHGASFRLVQTAFHKSVRARARAMVVY